MGLDYGYEIILPRGNARRFIETLAAHVDADDAARLRVAMQAEPDRFMKVVQQNARLVREGDLGLTFLFPPDDLVAEYIEEYEGRESLSDATSGRVKVGYVWCEFLCGARFASFHATAATSSMSRLFESSPAVRSTFVQIGQQSGALFVAFDDEQQDLQAVWPTGGRTGARPHDLPLLDEPNAAQIDAHCARMLEFVGIRA